jgi:hypothetical protein
MALLDWLDAAFEEWKIMDAPVTPISLWAAMMASNSSTWSMSPFESSVFHSGLRIGGLPDLSGSWGTWFPM